MYLSLFPALQLAAQHQTAIDAKFQRSGCLFLPNDAQIHAMVVNLLCIGFQHAVWSSIRERDPEFTEWERGDIDVGRSNQA